MHLADTNVWLALSVRAHSHHKPTAAWFESLTEVGTVAFCRATQQGFLRLTTNTAVMAGVRAEARTNDEAWAVFEALLADDRVDLLEREPTGTTRWWRQYSSRDAASTKLWMDAYLAAFAIAGGLTLVTYDTAFRQFDGLDLLLI